MKLRALLIVCSLLAVSLAARAEEPADYAFAQAPGAAVPAGAMFTESDGRRIRFGDLAGHRPVVLALGYFHCPMLCSIVRDDMLEALSHTGDEKPVPITILRSVSIDPAETVRDAATAEAEDAARYPAVAQGSADRPDGWHFSRRVQGWRGGAGDGCGVQEPLRCPSETVPASGRTRRSHPGGSRLGPTCSEPAITRATSRAPSRWRPAAASARAALPLLLLCFHFDAATGRYSLEVMKLLRLAGILTVLTIGGALLLAFRGERRRSREQGTL